MIRKTLTILSLIGLLLSVGLWGASYYGFERIRLCSLWWSTITLADGVLVYSEREFNLEEQKIHEQNGVTSTEITCDWNFGLPAKRFLTLASTRFGSRFRRFFPALRKGDRNSPFKKLALWCPLWCVTVIFAIWPLWLMSPAYRHRGWKARGLCERCGYDLRASEARCPECGFIFGDDRRAAPRERLSRWASLLVAIVTFMACLLGLPLAVANLYMVVSGREYLPRLDETTVVIAIVITTVLAYLAARTLYSLLHWRRSTNSEDDGAPTSVSSG